MTAIHRRKMLEVILGSAAVAAVGSSVIPVPAESTPYRRRSIVLQALCPAAFTAASSAGGMEGRGEDREFCCWRWLTPHGWVRLSPIVH